MLAPPRQLFVIVLITTLTGTSLLRCEHEYKSSEEPDYDHKLDAHRLDICGKVELSQWQRREHAFDCEPLSPQRTWRGANAPGRDVRPGEAPFFVHLKVHNGSGKAPTRCAGTLIDYDYILTSAICLSGAENIDIVVGSDSTDATNGTQLTGDIWCQPDEGDKPIRADIAILRMNEKLVYNERVRPVCLSREQHIERASCLLFSKGNSSKLQANVVKRSNEKPLEFGESHSNYEPILMNPVDRGSPVVCYDACWVNSEGTPETRAFVVGAYSFHLVNTTVNTYIDFNLKADVIQAMTDRIYDGRTKDLIICHKLASK